MHENRQNTCTTNKTSRNGSQTGKTGTTAPTHQPNTRQNPNSKYCRRHNTQTEQQEKWTQTRPAHPVVTVGSYQGSTTFKTEVT